jgi:hypothetical protein
MTFGEQRLREMATDEPGNAGDEDVHTGRFLMSEGGTQDS